eukprot:TRINITY_DN13916_c0_g1_i1.p1 TRINITY_DN13916_c0_g1~~TRINITY_DN13916_c0_g1_i1.p1  ORF type:complete len:232 (+),score=28.84 TRINITY_DN13916_c0_g1_i1:47-742(+)
MSADDEDQHNTEQEEAENSSDSDVIVHTPHKRKHITEGRQDSHDPRIGAEYQLDVPPWKATVVPQMKDDAMAAQCGECVWSPGISQRELDEYLQLVREMYGARDFSEDQALRALHHHKSVQAALIQMLESPLAAHHVEDAFTPENKDAFDRAVRRFGKDFEAVENFLGGYTQHTLVAQYYSRKNALRFSKKIRRGNSSRGWSRRNEVARLVEESHHFLGKSLLEMGKITYS